MDTMSSRVVEQPAAQLSSSTPFRPNSKLFKSRSLRFKRFTDLVFGSLLVVALSVPMLLIALMIRLDSRGPVLFRQNRRGLGGHPFGCLKFRSMYIDQCDAHAHQQSCRNDPRITRVGAVLRRTSLDELPQIFNVLLGDMALVGPRPHAFGTSINGRLLPDISEDYLLRYMTRPGITGWAQVNGWRGILDTEHKLQRRLDHDFYYIVNWSPLLDLKILVRTLSCLKDRNAF